MSTDNLPRGSGRGCSVCGGPIGVSNTPRTRRKPATALCTWSMISVNSAIGSRNRYVRNTNPTRAPEVNPPAGPMSKPVPTTAMTVNTANTSPLGNRKAPITPARMLLRLRFRIEDATDSIIDCSASYARSVSAPAINSDTFPKKSALRSRERLCALTNRDWTNRSTKMSGALVMNATNANLQS